MDVTTRQRLLAAARGDGPADLLFSGGTVVNVLTGELLTADVAVCDGFIASVGPPREATHVEDVSGRYLIPGLIDAHVHLESSLVTPAEFARAVVPRGTTAVICDPHEIANVAGLDGIRWILEATEDLPLAIFVVAPSCVPASRLASSGASLDASDLYSLVSHPRVIGLGEVMNVPGAVLGDDGVWSKLEAFRGRPIDGHAPGVAGGWLQAYAAAGIMTDHECTSQAEAEDRLRLGLHVLLREGTAARNLADLLPIVRPETAPRCALCTDDRHPHDLLDLGHIDHLLRLAVKHGLDPVTAVRLATLSPAELYRLPGRGALAPARRADIVVCEDLDSFTARQVWIGGRLVARGGCPVGDWGTVSPAAFPGTMAVASNSLDVRVPASNNPVRVIVIEPGQLVTRSSAHRLPERDGFLETDPAAGIVKLAVIERHHATGRIGLGFVSGLGLMRGAIAGTVAHDHHNLVVAGADDLSMNTAVGALVAEGGGLVVTHGDSVLEILPLPIAGLMSTEPLKAIRDKLDRLLQASAKLGTGTRDPFMVLSFLALEVIPELKLTDHGLVDVTRFELVPIRADQP